MVIEELAPLAPEDTDDLDRWDALGRRLAELDPGRFQRALALAAAYVAIYENPDESIDAQQARLRRAIGRGGLS